MTTTVKFSTTEANGASAFDSMNLPIGYTDSECVNSYTKLRTVRSVKGFKTPMPTRIEIEER